PPKISYGILTRTTPAQRRFRLSGGVYRSEQIRSGGKTMKLVPALFAAAALLGTSAALAAPPAGWPSAQRPAQRCAAERTQMGTPAFKQLYGTSANRANAFGKCVAKVAAAQSQNEQGAAQTCKTEQAD